MYYASFILAILQIINASIVLVVLLCYFLNVFAAFFGFIIKVLSHFYYLALCSCVTVFYRSLSVLCSLRLPVIIKVLSYLILSTVSEAVHAGGDDRSPLAGLSG